MASFDIINFIQTNFEFICPAVTGVVGAVISALFLRKKNRIETSTQEFEMIKAGQFKEVTEILLKSGRMSYTEFYKTNNFLDIARRADKMFREESTEGAEQAVEIPPQNFDWHTRFFESCGNISDEEMQEVWARILAGEVRNPGSYSLRTLECLRNLTKDEAILFLRICEASVRIGRNVMLPRIDSYLIKNGIIYDDIIKLEDYGLVKADATITMTIDVKEENRILTWSDDWVLIARKREKGEKEGSHELVMEEYLFTQSGAELFNVIGINDKRDFSDIRDLYRDTYKGFEFECGQILEKYGDQIQYVVIRSEAHSRDKTKQDNDVL